jgi:hypothetical protein
MRTESGWTSIGSQVAAPRLLIPTLTTVANAPQFGSAPLRGSSLSAPALGGDVAPPAGGADSWATGWDSNAATGQATISRASDGRYAARDDIAVQATNPPPQDRSQPTNSWADLWGDGDPWEDTSQTQVTGQPAQQQSSTIASVPNRSSTSSQPPLLAPPANNLNVSTTAPPVIAQGGTAAAATTDSTPLTRPGSQPPWLPLLVVSLSLAGSLGANLYLGWSYLDARLKYSTLVRKTADKFRRAATAAA